MAYCPLLYYQSSLAVWADQQVFEPVHTSFEGLKQKILQILSSIPKQYSWAVSPSSPLPNAYVLLKAKKFFATGRPIISHTNSSLSKLNSTLAILLMDLVSVTWPEQFGELKTPRLWKYIHTYFSSMSPCQHLVMYNQDLTGFFTSIPLDRIFIAVEALIREYAHQTSSDPHQCTISVDVKTKQKHFRLFRGMVTALQSLGKRPVQLKDVPHLIQVSLKLDCFTALNRTWRQHRGVPIGGHVSPALSSVAIAYHEVLWKRTFTILHSSLFNNMLMIRYVDNRLIISEYWTSHDP